MKELGDKGLFSFTGVAYSWEKNLYKILSCEKLKNVYKIYYK